MWQWCPALVAGVDDRLTVGDGLLSPNRRVDDRLAHLDFLPSAHRPRSAPWMRGI
jgi:hypothetical protein